jgi:hypothetical protein
MAKALLARIGFFARIQEITVYLGNATMKKAKSYDPVILLVLGVLLLLMGTVLLLVTTRKASIFELLWPSSIIACGAIYLRLIIKRSFRPRYLFVSTFLILCGCFFFIYNAALSEVGLKRLWPIFGAFIGISLIPAGFKTFSRISAAFFIPAIAFISLSSLFFLFSFQIIKITFREFIVVWWPLFFVLAGLVLVGLYIVNRVRFSKSEKNGRS